MGQSQSCCRREPPLEAAESVVAHTAPSSWDNAGQPEFQEAPDSPCDSSIPGQIPVSSSSNFFVDLTKSNLKLVRGVSLRKTLRQGGWLWRINPADMDIARRSKLYNVSKDVEKLDRFLSHTWMTPGKRKYIALLLFSGWPIMLISWALGVVLATVLCALDVLPFFWTWEVSYYVSGFTGVIPCGCWVLTIGCVAAVGGLMVSPYIPAQAEDCFVDFVCIHQADDGKKQHGINNLASFLAASAELRVLWSQPLLTRLWCVFEIAAYRKVNPAGKVTLAPLSLESVVCKLFVILHCALLFLFFVRAAGSDWEIVMWILLTCGFFPFVYTLRQHHQSQRRLVSELEAFDLKEVHCFLESDRDSIYLAIEHWYGSLDAFVAHIRGPFRDEVFQLIRAAGRLPLPYLLIVNTCGLAWCLDELVALWKAGVDRDAWLSHFLGTTVGFTLLFVPSLQILVNCASEHALGQGCCRGQCLETGATLLVGAILYLVGERSLSAAAALGIGWVVAWTGMAMIFAILVWRRCWCA